MRLRNILLALGVFALVSGASLAVLWFIQSPVATATIAAPEAVAASTKAILVAVRAVPSGTLLRPEDVTWKDLALSDTNAAQIPQDKAADSKYLGALTTKPFAAGEALVTNALIKPGDSGFLAAMLTPGMRAVSIAVDAQQSASGLLLPDNRVDIILTQTFENDPDPARKSVGETLLRNLRVIAIDQRLGAAPSAPTKSTSPDASIPKVITLEVTEREAETLMVAGRIGRLDVSVRSLGGESSPPPASGSLWAADVSPALKGNRRPVPTPAAAPTPAATTIVASAAPIPPKSVEVMHGSKLEVH